MEDFCECPYCDMDSGERGNEHSADCDLKKLLSTPEAMKLTCGPPDDELRTALKKFLGIPVVEWFPAENAPIGTAVLAWRREWRLPSVACLHKGEAGAKHWRIQGSTLKVPQGDGDAPTHFTALPEVPGGD